MSNTLSLAVSLLAASEPTSQPSAALEGVSLSPLLTCLLAVGAIVLTVVVARRAARPQKLSLRDAPGRPNSLNPIHLLAVFLIWQISAYLALKIAWLTGMTAVNPQEGNVPADKGVVLALIVGQGIGIAIALLCGKLWFRLGLMRGMGLSVRHWLYDSLRSIVAVLAFLPVCFGLLAATSWMLLQFSIEPIDHSMLQALGEMNVAWKLVIAGSAIVLAALCEELIFRGLLQSMLRRYVGPWPAILLASLLFGLFHGQLQAIPALIALAIVLGYNYERTGRLWAPILIHALFNSVMILDRILYPLPVPT